MAMVPIEEEGNANLAEQRADVRVSIGSTPSQYRGAPEISEGEVNERYYRPLLRAALKGDWESTKRFFERDSASKMAKITSRLETVLHIAALSAEDQFVENLVEILSPHPKVLEMADRNGRTALHNAVRCGRIRMVKALVRSNPKLTQLQDNKGCVPLGIFARDAYMHKEIGWFLAENTTNDWPGHPFSSANAIETILDLTYAGHHDITLYLVEKYPWLMTMESTQRKEGKSIMSMLVTMKSNFRSGTKLGVLESLIYICIPVDLNDKLTDKNSDPAFQCLTRSLWNAAKIVVPTIKRIHQMKLRHVAAVKLARQVCNKISCMKTTEIIDFFQRGELLFQATSSGIIELVNLYFEFFPELIRTLPNGKRLATHAVEFRQERILRLFLNVSSTNELSLVPAPTRQESKLMMEAVAQYQTVFGDVANLTGAAFQLQRELQWYKAVESWLVHFKRAKRPQKTTFWEKFKEEHKTLFENGKDWVKDMAKSCMLVSTLITTVLFAAAFTMPGGNDNNTGVPLLLGHDSLLVFAISDALGLFSSVTAILSFLTILTSRHEVDDFLEWLPKNIIMGLSSLFLSLAFMMVAFVAALTIMLDKRFEWIFIPLTWLACLPMALFVWLRLPLLLQMVKSTYGPSIFYAEDIWQRGDTIIGPDDMIDEFDLRA